MIGFSSQLRHGIEFGVRETSMLERRVCAALDSPGRIIGVVATSCENAFFSIQDR
jgi:hypothetical protein